MPNHSRDRKYHFPSARDWKNLGRKNRKLEPELQDIASNSSNLGHQ